MSAKGVCKGGKEVAVDWVLGHAICEGDDDWHPWAPEVFGEVAS